MTNDYLATLDESIAGLEKIQRSVWLGIIWVVLATAGSITLSLYFPSTHTSTRLLHDITLVWCGVVIGGSLMVLRRGRDMLRQTKTLRYGLIKLYTETASSGEPVSLDEGQQT